MSSLADQFAEVVSQAVGLDDYNMLEASPELSGGMASRLLKSPLIGDFLARHGAVVGGYHHANRSPCNTDNVLLSFWQEYTRTIIFLRESGVWGQEPLVEDTLAELDLSMRKQRVWLGVIAPEDGVLYSTWQAWVHVYYLHIMWYVHKYKGIGSLSQEAIEDGHKQVHRDVGAYSVAGTRVATSAAWLRIINGYTIDLFVLRMRWILRNGGHISAYLCRCAELHRLCKACSKLTPWQLVLM